MYLFGCHFGHNVKRATRHVRLPVSRKQKIGFTLVELLVVIAVISILAALLFPVFAKARGSARSIACISNLRQDGMSISLYAQDYDGYYPVAVDPEDYMTPQIWASIPSFQALIPMLPHINDVLQPYIKTPELFHCPSDFGFDLEDLTGDIPIDPNGNPPNARPSSFQKFGTSYYYRTEIAYRHAGDPTFQTPAYVNVLFDGCGSWHGTSLPPALRYNIIFADGHTKSETDVQIRYYWTIPL